jgi:hypothetical protein
MPPVGRMDLLSPICLDTSQGMSSPWRLWSALWLDARLSTSSGEGNSGIASGFLPVQFREVNCFLERCSSTAPRLRVLSAWRRREVFMLRALIIITNERLSLILAKNSRENQGRNGSNFGRQPDAGEVCRFFPNG